MCGWEVCGLERDFGEVKRESGDLEGVELPNERQMKKGCKASDDILF
jgi:hypothetical protein